MTLLKSRAALLLVMLCILPLGACDNNIFGKLSFRVYKITYDGNGNTGGTVPSEPVTYNDGDSVTVLDNIGNLVKDETLFLGWNTEAEGTGDTYLAGDTLIIDKADVTLYALWNITVTFDSRGGSPVEATLNPQVLLYGDLVKKPQDPSYGYYEFAGWYSDYARTQQWDFDTPVEKSMTLNAKWSGGDSRELVVGAMPPADARYGHAAAVVNNVIYIFGGYDGGAYLDDVEAYYPATNTWNTTFDTLPSARAHHAAITVNGLIYIIGGTNGAALGSVDIFDPSQPSGSRWTSAPALDTARHSFAAAEVWHNTIYIFGGTPATAALDGGESFEVASPVWNTLTYAGNARIDTPAAAFGGIVYFLGAYNGVSYSANAFRYDSVNDTWSNIAKPPVDIRNHAAVIVSANERIFIFGGLDDGGNAVNTIYMYNPYSDSYTSMSASLSEAKHSFSASLVNGKVYIIGGRDSAGNPLSSVETYLPPAP